MFVVTFEEKLLGLKVIARPSDSAPVVYEVRTALMLFVLVLILAESIVKTIMTSCC